MFRFKNPFKSSSSSKKRIKLWWTRRSEGEWYGGYHSPWDIYIFIEGAYNYRWAFIPRDKSFDEIRSKRTFKNDGVAQMEAEEELYRELKKLKKWYNRRGLL